MKALLSQSRHIARCIMVGAWMLNKYQSQAREGSVLKAARNLKKQGVPLECALLILSVR